MGEPLRIGRSDKTGETFSVQRIIVALKMVAKAAEMEGLEMPFDEDGQMSPSIAGQFVVDVCEQVEQAMKNQGSLTVRYLGDLKPTVYPIDTHFFRINNQSDGMDDFSAILKKALLDGEHEEMTFINLANVRDVKIHVGNTHVMNVSSDIAFLSRLMETFHLWDKDPCSLCILRGV